MSDEVHRRFYKKSYSCKKALLKYDKKHADGCGDIDKELSRIMNYCAVVSLLVHTQLRKVKIGQKKARLMEIQINGGSVANKVGYA